MIPLGEDAEPDLSIAAAGKLGPMRLSLGKLHNERKPNSNSWANRKMNSTKRPWNWSPSSPDQRSRATPEQPP